MDKPVDKPVDKPLLKPVTGPRPPGTPRPPSQTVEGRVGNRYYIQVMPLWKHERIGDYTHRAMYFHVREGKPTAELMRRLGSSPENALELLVIAAENSIGINAHTPFVRAAAQVVKDDMERTRQRKEQMRAALEGAAETPKADAG